MWMYGVREKVLLCTKEVKTGSKPETWFDLDVWCWEKGVTLYQRGKKG